MADPTLGLEEWLSLMYDCRVPGQLTDGKLRQIYGVVSSTRDGDELALDGFVESLVHVAFVRANPPVRGTGAGAPPAQPLPGCLARFLRERVLAFARQDTLLLLAQQVMTPHPLSPSG